MISFGASFPTHIALGRYHSCCAIDNLGDVKCWGDNFFGQVGIGSFFGDIGTPTTIAISETVTEIAIGASHSCAITVSNDTYCWGWNEEGQLGDGTYTNRNEPTLVKGGSPPTVIQLAGGFDFSCGIVTGKVYCTGLNRWNQLGRPDPYSTNTPKRALEINRASQVALGFYHGCAIEGDVVKCWGFNFAGQVGIGSSDLDVDTPTVVSFPTPPHNQTMISFHFVPKLIV